MKSIIKKIMAHPSIRERPPVLIDIGASGHLHKQWKSIAPYSICVAFDADTRDFAVSKSEDKGWKKLYLFNRLVATKTTDNVDFYLTKSPHCSSSLPPNNDSLESWSFSQLFQVEKIVKMTTIELQAALAQIGIDYIDWFKTDSQGTDLRIFDSLNEKIRDKILAAEFEPGIIDSYIGEDKLYNLMAYMDKRPFWISHMEIKGSHRIHKRYLSSLNLIQRRSIGSFLKEAPGWCEITYLNSLHNDDNSCREYLLAWIFASLIGEHGFALHTAEKGAFKFQEPLFSELCTASSKALSSGYLKFAVKAVSKIARFLIGGK
jgi:hypothetical protein